MMFVHLRVGALVFIFVGHEEEEGVHTWNTEAWSLYSAVLQFTIRITAVYTKLS